MKQRAFSDWPPQLQAAVNAYDEARREIHSTGTYRSAAMSDANKSTIAPMIMAAVSAYLEASGVRP